MPGNPYSLSNYTETRTRREGYNWDSESDSYDDYREIEYEHFDNERATQDLLRGFEDLDTRVSRQLEDQQRDFTRIQQQVNENTVLLESSGVADDAILAQEPGGAQGGKGGGTPVQPGQSSLAGPEPGGDIFSTSGDEGQTYQDEPDAGRPQTPAPQPLNLGTISK